MVSEYDDTVFGFQFGKHKFPDFDLTHNWVKWNIFWELSYWKTNLLRHNLIPSTLKRICLKIFSTWLWTWNGRQKTTSKLA
jgi:hypothetical protein